MHLYVENTSNQILIMHMSSSCFNPPTTTRVKISQNFDILPKVYRVHLKVKHCQTLRVVRTFTGKNESTIF